MKWHKTIPVSRDRPKVRTLRQMIHLTYLQTFSLYSSLPFTSCLSQSHLLLNSLHGFSLLRHLSLLTNISYTSPLGKKKRIQFQCRLLLILTSYERLQMRIEDCFAPIFQLVMDYRPRNTTSKITVFYLDL